MSEQIDWSKAPEGATHWELESYGASAGWMRNDGGEWFFLSSEGRWLKHIISNVSAVRLVNMIARPTTPSWSGEGLPPVGVVCMAGCEKVVIVAHHCNGIHAIYAESESDGLLYYGEPNEFRPIRTPEQIAEDEREAAILDMERICRIGDFGSGGLAALYDAGYRKP